MVLHATFKGPGLARIFWTLAQTWWVPGAAAKADGHTRLARALPRVRGHPLPAVLMRRRCFAVHPNPQGYYSFLFAKAGYNVLAFEPMPHNRRAIEATLCLNPDIRTTIPHSTRQMALAHLAVPLLQASVSPSAL